jgi:glutamate formiminotransferase
MIECIPNVSEGRRPDVVEALAETIRSTDGAILLDYSADASHNRSVFTFIGEAAALRAAVLKLFGAAIDAIDLRTHRGGHPRLGAVDVVPFVPLRGATMDECVRLSRQAGADVARAFEIPVFLYEEAATSPMRRRLETIRRGQFEGLAAKMDSADWRPDFGPPGPHLTAGATVIGARRPLIAFNVNLASTRPEIARAVATAVRFSSGGLPAVKAMGVRLEDGIVQVSMNVTDYTTTPLTQVFEAVQREAARHGVDVRDSEIVGLVPKDALSAADAVRLRVRGFGPDRILEERIVRSQR